jgi:hypothetical protein
MKRPKKAVPQQRRTIELLVDREGDVVFARFDRQSGTGGSDVAVMWPGDTPTHPSTLIRVSYLFPRKAKP